MNEAAVTKKNAAAVRTITKRQILTAARKAMIRAAAKKQKMSKMRKRKARLKLMNRHRKSRNANPKGTCA